MAEVAKETAVKETVAKETTNVSVDNTPAKEVKDTTHTIDENEIRVTAQGKMRNYVTYAASLFTDKNQTTVVLKGMGRVINKTVSLAEILKRRVKGLHQLTEIGSVEVTDTTPTQEEDADPEDATRLLSVISIVLTTQPPDDCRYQAPLPDEEVEPLKRLAPRRGRGRGNAKSRGGGRRRPGKGEQEGGGTDSDPSGATGQRGRRMLRGGRGGRGARGGRGRGRKVGASKTGEDAGDAPAPATAPAVATAPAAAPTPVSAPAPAATQATAPAPAPAPAQATAA